MGLLVQVQPCPFKPLNDIIIQWLRSKIGYDSSPVEAGLLINPYNDMSL
jgi:hypothetical protein